MNLIIFLIYILSFISIFLSNFFLLWILIEISSLIYISIISLLNFKKNRLLYFLISSISRILILFSFLILSNNFFINFNYFYSIIFIFSIWIKIRIFPIHFWRNIFTKNLNYILIFIFITFIKFIPILIIYYFININKLLFLILIISLIISPLLIIFQSSFKLIFTYSSIFHSSLIIFLIYLNNEILIIYLILYIIILYILFLFLNKFNINNIIELKINIFINNKNKYFLNFIIIIYCQFPPFFSFLIKINFIQNLLIINNWFLSFCLLLIISSILSTFNYLNYFNLNFLDNLIKPKYLIINNNYKLIIIKKKLLIFIIILIIFFIPII